MLLTCTILYCSQTYQSKSNVIKDLISIAFKQGRSEHTDRNVELKPPVLFRTNYDSIERFSQGVTVSCLHFTYLPHNAKLQVLPIIIWNDFACSVFIFDRENGICYSYLQKVAFQRQVYHWYCSQNCLYMSACACILTKDWKWLIIDLLFMYPSCCYSS